MNPRASDGGDFLRVVYGAKGGRPRDVPLAEKLEFDSLDEMNKTGAEVEFAADLGRRAYQRDVLERAKLFADRNRRGILAHEGMTLKQNKRRFYYVLSRVGVTKGELGVSAHGLRHSYAAEIYEEEAGFAPPVSRRSPGQVTDAMKEAYLHARQVVSLHTGHARPSISKAYVGSQTKLEKGRNFRIAQWLERTEGSLAFQNALRQSGVVQCWLGGSAAAGIEFMPTERLRIYVRFAKPLTDARVHAHLVEQLERILDVRVDLSAHLPAHEPEDSMQVFVREDGGTGGRGGNLV